MSKLGIFIFHRDFRIVDNKGLNNFCALCDQVIPIFIFTHKQVDNEKNEYKSIHSVRFMIESLGDLHGSLNGHLYTFYGDTLDVLRELHKLTKFTHIGFNEDISPFAKERTKSIRGFTSKYKGELTLETYDDYYLCDFNNESILNDGRPYVKFSAFERRAVDFLSSNPENINIVERSQLIKKKCKLNKNTADELIQRRSHITLEKAYVKFVAPSGHKCCKGIVKHGLEVEAMEIWEGSRKKGLQILSAIKGDKFDTYGQERNALSYPTTQLSAFLKYGLVSVREACRAMLKGKCGNARAMTNNPLFRQLLWREFYAIILYHVPRVLVEPFQEKYKKLKWTNNAQWTAAWKDGRTGYPIVDACMTQMNKTGYMHNRGRLIVSSFLVKLLLTDWQVGEQYFASMLVDYDPASNNGNWQWVAGTGTDSMPYFRIFNPWTQGDKYDGDASYIKKWLPQLKEVEAAHLHQWDKYYTQYDLTAIDYTAPIINYVERRKKALSVYKNV